MMTWTIEKEVMLSMLLTAIKHLRETKLEYIQMNKMPPV